MVTELVVLLHGWVGMGVGGGAGYTSTGIGRVVVEYWCWKCGDGTAYTSTGVGRVVVEYWCWK